MELINFGQAIEAAKNGARIARETWLGKVFIVYQKGYPQGIPCNKQTADAFGYCEGDLFKCNPYLQIRQADGTHQMYTVAQDDVLAEDWKILE